MKFSFYPPSDGYTIEVLLNSGRRFRYRIGPFLRRVTADQADHHVESLVRETMAEKFKTCEWDRNHPLVHSEDEIRRILMHEFLKYREWLREKPQSQGVVPNHSN
jgi:hypothetical protein